MLSCHPFLLKDFDMRNTIFQDPYYSITLTIIFSLLAKLTRNLVKSSSIQYGLLDINNHQISATVSARITSISHFQHLRLTASRASLVIINTRVNRRDNCYSKVCRHILHSCSQGISTLQQFLIELKMRKSSKDLLIKLRNTFGGTL